MSWKWLLPTTVAVLALAVLAGLVAHRVYQPSPAPPQDRVPPPGPGRVELGPGARGHPDHEAIRSLLQQHFDAINARHYQRWADTVVAARIAEQPENVWRTAYRSTQDGSILIYRIDSVEGDELRVLVAFTSTQDPVDAPAAMRSHCLRWRMTYAVVSEAGQLKLDSGVAGGALFEPCR